MFNLNNRLLLVLRGVPGCGKSSFAKYLECLVQSAEDGKLLCQEGNGCTICSADNFFTEKYGYYNWNAAEIGVAHNYCRTKCENAMNDGIELIIIDNVNAKVSDFSFYIDKAKEYGYSYTSLVVENRNETKNIHGVNEKTLIKQELSIRNSLKLL